MDAAVDPTALFDCKYCRAPFSLLALQPHLRQCVAREAARCTRKELLANAFDIPRELLDSFDFVPTGTPCGAADLVLPGVYLGNKESAVDEGFLREKRVAFVLNCAVELPIPVALYSKCGIDVKQLALMDELDSDIAAHFDESVAFVRDALLAHERDGSTLLVHCSVGQSRSPTIVMAAMLVLSGMSLRASWLCVKRARPICYPQPTFFLALMRLECALSGLEVATIPKDVLKLHMAVLV